MKKLAVFVAGILVVHTASGCAGQSGHRPTQADRTCTGIYNKEGLASCEFLARAGDAEAAYKVARSYANTSRRWHDKRAAFNWYKVAANAGHKQALKIVFDSYRTGLNVVPENSLKAEEYLNKAVEAKAEWAQLVLAKRLEESDPQGALNLYLKAARINNCHAQYRLAKAYIEGDIANRNPTQAYVWALLGSVDNYDRRSSYHNLAWRGYVSGSCDGIISEKIKLKRELPKQYIQVAEQAAARWSPGQTEPMLTAPPNVSVAMAPPKPKPKLKPKPSHESSTAPTTSAPKVRTPKIAGAFPGRLNPGSRSVGMPRWVPISADRRPTSRVEPKKTTELFKLVNRSVWSVYATRSVGSLRSGKGVSQGSAVAISRSDLLTNCHVVENRSLVFIKQGETITQARTVSADPETDRCILRVSGEALTSVVGVRTFDSLEVGEAVFTVGSPSGLERTLGSGIVSGLRRSEGQRFVQTDAPSSPGSSGGGLFDSSGNLIGITTFKVRKTDGIFFAIAAEDFYR